MALELVNLPKLQNASVLAVLMPQVTAASYVFVLMSMIMASVSHCGFVVWTSCFQVKPAMEYLTVSAIMRSRTKLGHIAMMEGLL